jgi:hypothetical protein
MQLFDLKFLKGLAAAGVGTSKRRHQPVMVDTGRKSRALLAYSALCRNRKKNAKTQVASFARLGSLAGAAVYSWRILGARRER